LIDWLEERRDWPGAKDGSALFLNQRGHAHDAITGIVPARRNRLAAYAYALASL
jgi:hypothetical protein